MTLTKQTFDALCNTKYYMLIIDSVERGQYDYSGLYCIDVRGAVAEELEIARSKVTRNKFEEFMGENDYGAGNWEWMHLETDIADLLQQLNTHKVVDIHERCVADGEQIDDTVAHIAGKELDDVCIAGIALLEKAEQTDFVKTAIAQLQRRELGYIG